jgi:septal ring factor EnvC (AmiA/AmiB activator)
MAANNGGIQLKIHKMKTTRPMRKNALRSALTLIFCGLIAPAASAADQDKELEECLEHIDKVVAEGCKKMTEAADHAIKEYNEEVKKHDEEDAKAAEERVKAGEDLAKAAEELAKAAEEHAKALLEEDEKKALEYEKQALEY